MLVTFDYIWCIFLKNDVVIQLYISWLVVLLLIFKFETILSDVRWLEKNYSEERALIKVTKSFNNQCNVHKNVLIVSGTCCNRTFFNIDVNQKCSFPRKKFARWVLAVTELVATGTQSNLPISTYKMWIFHTT